MSEWPAGHVEELRRMVEKDHLSATRAASALNEMFGAGYSRNAVIGKCKRANPTIRLSEGHGGRPGPKGGPSQRKPRAKIAAAKISVEAIRKAAEPKRAAVTFIPRTVEASPQNVPLLELDQDGCRWPSDAPPFVFCNCRQIAGLPYCEPHSRLAYREPEPRTQRRAAWSL